MSYILIFQAFHTIAEALSAMSNILLTDAMGDSSYGIEITNHPLPNSIENKVRPLLFSNRHFMLL